MIQISWIVTRIIYRSQGNTFRKGEINLEKQILEENKVLLSGVHQTTSIESHVEGLRCPGHRTGPVVHRTTFPEKGCRWTRRLWHTDPIWCGSDRQGPLATLGSNGRHNRYLTWHRVWWSTGSVRCHLRKNAPIRIFGTMLHDSVRWCTGPVQCTSRQQI